MHWVANVSPVFGTPIPSLYLPTVDRSAAIEARRYFRTLARYEPTPLLSLTSLASELGVARLLCKDEGHRLGLHSFKALGGAYAVARLVHKHVEATLGAGIPIAELLEERSRKYARKLTVACATDGNHGRSVAWGAHLLGCTCVIFLHENVSKAREEAIAAFGARIVRVPGVYDDSCAEAARVSRLNGWHVVSDFATEAYDEVTSWVMRGYGVMVDEILTELEQRQEKLSHIFVQGGCGGLAAAIAGQCTVRLAEKPTIVVVEPDRANCLLQSARSQTAARIAASQPTCMAMLECYEPSHMAWPILERTAEFFVDIEDQAALDAHHRLIPSGMHAGPSGAAGFAGLLAARRDSELSDAVGLSASSRVLIIASEGITE